ncbi:Hsp20/alpha crystallin family protein [Candidatus Sumerlaeota bacterium]|nr:Hsp20/alpha crystallin family protein [Candidatus Sumerlaeota bacterium]
MALIKWRPHREWDPFADLFDLQKEINRLFNLSLSRSRPLVEGAWAPAVDIYKKGDSYILEAELPGMSKDDIELSVQDNTVTIRGKKESKKEAKDEDYFCYERSFGEFYRNFQLPAEIDANKVKASFSDGVLRAELPIAESAKPKQIKIEIKEKK